MKDQFDKIHELLTEKHYDQVLNLVLNSTTNKIESPYCEDLNHAWYLMGNIFTDKEDYESAISAFKKSLADWPEDDQAMSALANCYMEIGKPIQAQKQLEHAIKIKPKDEYFYNLGNALFDQCEYGKAIELYKKIGRDDGELYELGHKNIAHAKRKMKKR
ncbi:MAG: tetratricopeptide repeat protein [Pseudomonadales bacterium]